MQFSILRKKLLNLSSIFLLYSSGASDTVSNLVSISYKLKTHKVFNAIFTHEDIKSLKSLAANKEIIVCKPDKGRGVVLLDKTNNIPK